MRWHYKGTDSLQYEVEFAPDVPYSGKWNEIWRLRHGILVRNSGVFMMDISVIRIPRPRNIYVHEIFPTNTWDVEYDLQGCQDESFRDALIADGWVLVDPHS